MSNGMLVLNSSCTGAGTGTPMGFAVRINTEMIMIFCCLLFYSARLPGAGHFPMEEGHRIRLQDPGRQRARRAGGSLTRFRNLYDEKDAIFPELFRAASTAFLCFSVSLPPV